MANLFEVHDPTRNLYIEMLQKYPNHRDKVDMLWGKVSVYLAMNGDTVYSRTGHIVIEIIYGYEFSQVSIK